MTTSPVSDYMAYKRAPVRVAGEGYTLVSKPGAFAHGRTDAATHLLAARLAQVAAGATVVDLNCGTGLAGLVAARRAGRVVLTDRNVVNVGSAERTLAENGASNAEVRLAQGAREVADASADVVAIRIPKERLAVLQLVAEAFRVLRAGGTCYLAGATNEGIRTAAGTLAQLFGSERTLDRDGGHHLVVATRREGAPGVTAAIASPYLDPDVFHEYEAELASQRVRIATRPGVFSFDHLDEATAILAGLVDVRGGEAVLDLGCGAGALGTLAGMRSGDARVLLLDADVEAVRSAARTARLAGLAHAEARTSDVGAAVGEERFDVVLTNPPFHVGKATDLDVPAQFIRDAWTALRPGGRMLLVANRTLPYERIVHETFGAVATVHDGARFKVLRGVRAS